MQVRRKRLGLLEVTQVTKAGRDTRNLTIKVTFSVGSDTSDLCKEMD